MRCACLLTTLLLPLTLLTGCVSGRSVDEVRYTPGQMWPSRLDPTALQAAVPLAAAQMELELEHEPSRIGEAWVFHRGARLVDPALWWVITIYPNPDSPGHSLIAVGGIPEYRGYSYTGETESKKGELALRIILIAMKKQR